jgi:hypothetical protein
VTERWAGIIAFGDNANAERPFVKDRSTRIAFIQASALKACNRPVAASQGVDLPAAKPTPRISFA